MAVIARIVGLSALAALAGVWLGFAFFHEYGDCSIPCTVLGCVGSLVGAIAATAREIVAVLRRRISG